jgi:hypothetical protein
MTSGRRASMRNGAGPRKSGLGRPERAAARRCATRSAIDPETNKCAGSGVPFLPAAFRRPGNPRERLQGRSYRQRDDHPIRSICETSRRNRLDHGGALKGEPKFRGRTRRGQRRADSTTSSKGSEYAGPQPSPSSGASGWIAHTEGGKGGAMA